MSQRQSLPQRQPVSTQRIQCMTSRSIVCIRHRILIPVMAIDVEAEGFFLIKTLSPADGSEEVQLKLPPEPLNRRAEEDNMSLGQLLSNTKRTQLLAHIQDPSKPWIPVPKTSIGQAELSNCCQLRMLIHPTS